MKKIQQHRGLTAIVKHLSLNPTLSILPSQSYTRCRNMAAYTVTLNNHFQTLGQTHLLEQRDNGFANRVWEWQYVYNGQVLGTGQGATKSEAKENAARAALEALRVPVIQCWRRGRILQAYGDARSHCLCATAVDRHGFLSDLGSVTLYWYS